VRLVIFTALERGVASIVVPRLVAAPHHDLAGIVFSEMLLAGRRNWFERRVKKIAKIGVLGAANGIRMRRWFFEVPAERLGLRPIDVVAAEAGVPIVRVPHVNHPMTVEYLQSVNADVGISLGNSYIGRRVFSTPRRGMINIHHEMLPEYRGAQSVIWQIHNGSRQSGYTIHQIDASIDGGAILYQQPVSIVVRRRLDDTVADTCAELYARSVDGLMYVLNHFDELARDAKPQGSGASYTTPSFRQYRRIVREHRAMVAQENDGAGCHR
jgi:methionyl-tRNA formyltransferase